LQAFRKIAHIPFLVRHHADHFQALLIGKELE